jgi:RecG-like helicase
MDDLQRKQAEAIYKIRSKEKMIRATYTSSSETTRDYLEGLIENALKTTHRELKEQTKQGIWTKEEATSIYEALETMPVIKDVGPNVLIATFPEFKLNELYIHSVALERDDSDRQTKKEIGAKRKTNSSSG